MSILLPILTFVLIVVAFFLILVVLMQKAKSDGGMGAAIGGGMAEATFGADTGNVLSKATINAAILFFVLSFGLYLGWIYQLKHGSKRWGGAAHDSAPVLPPTPAPVTGTAPAGLATPPAPLAPAARWRPPPRRRRPSPDRVFHGEAAALFILPALWLAGGMLAGPASTGPAPDYAQIGELDQAAGRAVMAEVRQAGISGPYYLEFALRDPARGGAPSGSCRDGFGAAARAEGPSCGSSLESRPSG